MLLMLCNDLAEAAGRADAVPTIDPNALLSAYVRRCIGHEDDAPAEYRIEAMREALEEVGAPAPQQMTTQGEAVAGWVKPHEVDAARRNKDGSALAVFVHPEQTEMYSMPIYTGSQS